jgi:hypothetical protein
MEVWIASYDVNFNCDLLKVYWEVQKCISLVRICYFIPQDLLNKNYTTLNVLL